MNKKLFLFFLSSIFCGQNLLPSTVIAGTIFDRSLVPSPGTGKSQRTSHYKQENAPIDRRTILPHFFTDFKKVYKKFSKSNDYYGQEQALGLLKSYCNSIPNFDLDTHIKKLTEYKKNNKSRAIAYEDMLEKQGYYDVVKFFINTQLKENNLSSIKRLERFLKKNKIKIGIYSVAVASYAVLYSLPALTRLLINTSSYTWYKIKQQLSKFSFFSSRKFISFSEEPVRVDIDHYENGLPLRIIKKDDTTCYKGAEEFPELLRSCERLKETCTNQQIKNYFNQLITQITVSQNKALFESDPKRFFLNMEVKTYKRFRAALLGANYGITADTLPTFYQNPSDRSIIQKLETFKSQFGTLDFDEKDDKKKQYDLYGLNYQNGHLIPHQDFLRARMHYDTGEFLGGFFVGLGGYLIDWALSKNKHVGSFAQQYRIPLIQACMFKVVNYLTRGNFETLFRKGGGFTIYPGDFEPLFRKEGSLSIGPQEVKENDYFKKRSFTIDGFLNCFRPKTTIPDLSNLLLSFFPFYITNKISQHFINKFKQKQEKETDIHLKKILRKYGVTV
jgi:hypothetical protein